MGGPLNGLRIVELAGLGAGPFCAMMLADHGAEVIRVERPNRPTHPGDCLARSRASIVLDFKHPDAIRAARDLCASADGLIESFRPGVMERLGLGPDVLLRDNPELVYGRLTGWGQDGPMAQAAGHDINYIAIAGVLHTVGAAASAPVLPVNYVADFAGGGMMLAFGMVSALLHVRNGGDGQVVDCAMSDGAAVIASMTWSMLNRGRWRDERGTNLLDGGAHFYNVYECADGKYIALGAIEPQFYATFRDKAGLADPAFEDQLNRDAWPALKQKLAEVFRTRTGDEWCALLDGADACVTPVLSLAEAPGHPHNAARGTFTTIGGAIQPAPAPRYSLSVTDAPRAPPQAGGDGDRILRDLGYSNERIDLMGAAGVFGEPIAERQTQ